MAKSLDCSLDPRSAIDQRGQVTCLSFLFFKTRIKASLKDFGEYQDEIMHVTPLSLSVRSKLLINVSYDDNDFKLDMQP